MGWILTLSTTPSSCMQTHNSPSRLGCKQAHTSGPTEGISGLTHTFEEHCPASSLSGCCPCAPSSRQPTGWLILPPAAEGMMPNGNKPKVATQEPLCASLLFTHTVFLACVCSELNFKCYCMSTCLHAWRSVCLRVAV